MKRTILIGALCAFVTSAFAQVAPSDPAANLGQDFQAFSVAQKHVVEDMQALMQEYQQQKKQINDLMKQIDPEKAKNVPPPPPAAPRAEVKSFAHAMNTIG
jgi:Spy/CpxP family protein refolding chaperone